jgi:hypothetical protein
MSSKAIHQAISYPNYISWGCFSFVTEELEKTISRLNPDDVKLESIILQLENEEKLCIICRMLVMHKEKSRQSLSGLPVSSTSNLIAMLSSTCFMTLPIYLVM